MSHSLHMHACIAVPLCWLLIFRQDKQNEVLVTNSSLNEKQMDLEQIRGAVKREEHKSEQEGERVMGVCRESGQVMLAINNLHSR